MSLWSQQYRRSTEWAVYHKFGRVHLDVPGGNLTAHMSPECARYLGEQLIRWAKEADTYVPPTPTTERRTVGEGDGSSSGA